MITIDKFTELAHRTASRYSHRTEPARVFYTFTADTLADFHRRVCSEAEARAAVPAGWVPDIESLTEKISDLLRCTYHCTRVWEAWHVGTMSQDDFEPVDESETPREIAEEIHAMLAAAPQPVAQPGEPVARQIGSPIGSDRCPITGRPFWGNIDHPELGLVATYGGPFDTYTIPAREEDGELRCERYDHDDGCWVEGGEPIGWFYEDQQEQPEQAAQPTQAATDVLAERHRQITAEGWTPEHDDEHRDCEMAAAAATYALCNHGHHLDLKCMGAQVWPGRWNFNDHGYRRNLVKAGALILAEIERIDRAASPKPKD